MPPVDLAPLETYLDSIALRGRTMLLPALHKAHELYGWAPREAQEAISNALRVPLADIHGVIEFYSMFYNKPMPRHVVRLCEDPACHLTGAHHVADEIKKHLDQDTAFELVTCLGMCDLAPAGLNGPIPAGQLTANNIPDFLTSHTNLSNDNLQSPILRRSSVQVSNLQYPPTPRANLYGSPRWLTARTGVVDPSSLADYEKHNGYQGLRTATTSSPSPSKPASSGGVGRCSPSGGNSVSRAGPKAKPNTSSSTRTNPNPARSKTVS